MSRLVGRSRHRRRGQRLDGRHGRVRARAVSGRPRRRVREPRAGGGLERRHRGDGESLGAPPERGRVARRGHARAARLLRRLEDSGRGDRAAAAQPGRHAPAVGSWVSDPLAARDRVLLPAEARPEVGGAERVLRRGVRPRRGARGRGGHGRLHAPAARRDREGGAVRRGLLPLQRGDGLVLPLPAGRLGGRLLSGSRVHSRPRRGPRGPALPGEPARAPPVPLEASWAPDRGAREAAEWMATADAATLVSARRP